MARKRPSEWMGMNIGEVDANMLEATLLMAAEISRAERYGRNIAGIKHADVASLATLLGHATEV